MLLLASKWMKGAAPKTSAAQIGGTHIDRTEVSTRSCRRQGGLHGHAPAAIATLWTGVDPAHNKRGVPNTSSGCV